MTTQAQSRPISPSLAPSSRPISPNLAQSRPISPNLIPSSRPISTNLAQSRPLISPPISPNLAADISGTQLTDCTFVRSTFRHTDLSNSAIEDLRQAGAPTINSRARPPVPPVHHFWTFAISHESTHTNYLLAPRHSQDLRLAGSRFDYTNFAGIKVIDTGMEKVSAPPTAHPRALGLAL